MIEPKSKQIVSIYDKSDKPISHTRLGWQEQIFFKFARKSMVVRSHGGFVSDLIASPLYQQLQNSVCFAGTTFERYVNDIDWSPRTADKQRLASVCRDSSLRIWALRESSVFLQDKRNTVSQAEKVRWDPTESSHLAMVIDRRLKFYDTRKKQFDTFKARIKNIYKIQIRFDFKLKSEKADFHK